MESAEHLWTVDRLPPRALVSVEHAAVSAVSSGESWSRRSNFDTALLINASVDSGLAAATCVGVGGGGGGVSRRQRRELESAEHLWTVDRLPLLVSVSVEAVVVSADGSGVSWSRRSTCGQWIGCRNVCWF